MSEAGARSPRVAVADLVSTWFGCGYSPFAPGTAGSLAAVGIGFALVKYAAMPRWGFMALALALAPLAVWAAGVTAEAHGKKDPGYVVVDEVLGQWIALAGARVYSWQAFLAAFLLFRLFDIWKPSPVREMEALPGGLGINADDAMAGVYAALVLLAAGWFNLL
jgi:phosphatidylglycerophosphatase A